MDINLIRKANLQLLLDREYGAGTHGAKADLAKRVDKQPETSLKIEKYNLEDVRTI